MKRSMILSSLVIVFMTNTITGQETADFFNKADTFFKMYVEDGKVDYRSIKNEPSKLDDLLTLAGEIRIEKSDIKNYQAFWINTYNLVVIKSVVEHYPLNSPLDVAGFFDKALHEVGGAKTTLNDIENIKLREAFPNEARFHFVLVCAGLGCPPIIPQAYLPAILEQQLEIQTSKALNDPLFIRSKKNKVEISQIFEWYAVDFNRNGENPISFINRYKTEKIPAGAKVSYYPYDWKLNELK